MTGYCAAADTATAIPVHNVLTATNTALARENRVLLTRNEGLQRELAAGRRQAAEAAQMSALKT